LNPHFLFNSMNGIRSLIADDPDRARTAVTELSRTLRYALRAHDEEFVPLAREFAIVDDYLALETLRLGDRLTVQRDVAEDAGQALIPAMLLQTVVENAIKHGIARLPNGGTLGVSARIADGALFVRVDNPRPVGARASSNTADEEANASGIGLSNARERLRLLLGADANIELDLSKPDCATARLRIPQEAA
ncbi:MAG TPA: histidine kinase, partial [Polyangiaceae bacterium]|nr:histidine kinase [Polyangiaceae bacterium]